MSISFMSSKGYLALITFSLMFILSGCLSESHKSDLPPAPKTPQPMPVSKLDPYLIQVGDVLEIKPLLNPELNEQVTVRPDGMISTALVTDMQAYGRRVSEVQNDLNVRYSYQLLHPRVSVILRSFAPNRVYVTGEVNTPGEFVTVGPNLTLLQALSRAGGLKNSAGIDNMIIVRHGAGNKPTAYQVNYRSAASGSDVTSDVRLAPYDVVYVPRSGIGDAYLHFQQYVQQFVPASFGVSYQLNDTKISN